MLEDTTIDITAVIPHILYGGGERFDLEEGSSSSEVGVIFAGEGCILIREERIILSLDKG